MDTKPAADSISVPPADPAADVVAPVDFRGVIDLWKTAQAMADDINETAVVRANPDLTVTAKMVGMWRFRQSINGTYWSAVAEASTKVARRVTVADLADIAAGAARPERKRA